MEASIFCVQSNFFARLRISIVSTRWKEAKIREVQVSPEPLINGPTSTQDCTIGN